MLAFINKISTCDTHLRISNTGIGKFCGVKKNREINCKVNNTYIKTPRK